MKNLIVTKKQNCSDECIVCGIKNPLSLNADFYETEDNLIVAITCGKDHHQSYPNRMHGGVISALLDEAMGRVIQIKSPQIWAVTTELNVKYHKPVPLNEDIICVCKIVKDSTRMYESEGFIEDKHGTLLARATAKYFKQPIENIANSSTNDMFWELVQKSSDPVNISIFNDFKPTI